MSESYAKALATFAASGNLFNQLPFFQNGSAQRLSELLDSRSAAGEAILPEPADVMNALTLTPLENTRVVILGQDPYPTPGDAHGLAFSIARAGKLPRSLSNIFKELAQDTGAQLRTYGMLTDWASQGVLLLNTCFTVAANAAGSHRKLGWETLSDQVISAASTQTSGIVFVLWGADAQAKLPLIDSTRHMVIASAHPSPLSARRDFFGSKPFSRANKWLGSAGRGAIDWG